ncbi:MAG TPA: TonB-dependent receptor plug domain-containing protein [Opitutaceae bacterium]|nr:TonB-dependent receptor plug domain-containing protein [Opitutaceae bacterium]
MPYPKPYVRPGRRAEVTILLAALIGFAGLARAQQAPANPPATASANGDETIMLNPFEVKTDKDTSYGALNSTSITKFNTPLNQVPMSADIFTEDFMRDIDATDVNQTLLEYGAGMGMAYATTGSGTARDTQPGDRSTDGDRWTSPRLGKHGLTASNVRRDGFVVSPTSANSLSNFDIDRIEVLEGPQGLLYGAGGPGGTIVTTSKRATFDQNRGSIAERIDQYGSKRTLLDANVGSDRVAVRVALLREEEKNRRLFIGGRLDGYYGQVALRLPFHSILRLEGEYTYSKRIQQSDITVKLDPADPRNGDSLAYLLATNQIGTIVAPSTQQTFGPIANGKVDWFDYQSFAGGLADDRHSNEILQGTLESVWTSWLSTSIGYNWDKDEAVRADSGISALTAPGVNGNPFNDWAVNSILRTTHRPELSKALHASALITKNLFNEKVRTQTVFGYDHEWNGSSPDDYGYYQSDANGTVVTNPANPKDLGRTPMPNQWWAVGGGPLRSPLVPIETPVLQGAQDGNYYALVERNPRNPAWIGPGNPWGTAANAYPGAGITGINNGPWGFLQRRVDAFYASNYSQWYRDWINTLVGFRRTHTANPVQSGGTPNGTSFSNDSYNLGLNGRITHDLRWYAELSSTYDNPFGFNDPVGIPPPTSSAVGREIGLKFNFLDNRISGQVDYYRTNAKDQVVNYGAGYCNNMNPVGLNGTWRGIYNSGRNNWVPLNFVADGEEFTLTAAPTPHWRIRLAASIADGRVQSDKRYAMIYNDQFYTGGKAGGRGPVTYSDGTPFLVPVDPTKVKKLNGLTDPSKVLAGSATEQLTTDMIGDPNSPYYAWAGTQVSVSGNISATSAVGKALKYFSKPGVGTALTGALGLPISDLQYNWSDPAGTGGTWLVARSGEKTVGYPVYSVNLTNAYEFSKGWLKGVGVVFALTNGWQYRTYYYNDVDGSRKLYERPELGWQVNLNPYYTRKIGRFVWRTQLNISNLFNHYRVAFLPDDGLGYSRPQNVGVAWYGQPRSISWTNTIFF